MNKQPWLGTLSMLCLGISSFSASADFYAGALVSYADSEYRAPVSTSSNAVAPLDPQTISSKVSDASPLLVQAQAGYFFNDYLALEGRYGTSMQREGRLNVDRLVSAYAKLNVPISDRFAMYGLTGYSSVEINHQESGTIKEQGFSFGVGMHFALSRHNAVVFEFVDSVSEESLRLNAFTLGFQHRF